MHHNHHDHKSELPLILFTLCVSASVGVVLVDLVLSVCEAISNGGWEAGFAQTGAFGTSGFAANLGSLGPVSLTPQVSLGHVALALAALALTTIGMLASVAHLAKPLRAPRALTNLKSSWLSREILVVAAFWGLIAAWLITQLISALAAFCVAIGCLAVGCALLIAAARAYAIPSQPAWHGADTTIELFATACGAGIPLACAIALWYQAHTPMPLAMGTPLDGGGIFPCYSCCPYLPTKALLAMAILGPVTAHLLYVRADKIRLSRLGSIDNPTPREDLARKQLEKLEGPKRAILGLVDASILVSAIAALIWVFLGTASLALASIPAALGCVAFFLARARFYQMAIVNRHAVRRNFR